MTMLPGRHSPDRGLREMGFAEDIVSVEGGAIAPGHPIGASGAVLATRLMHSKQRDGCKLLDLAQPISMPGRVEWKSCPQPMEIDMKLIRLMVVASVVALGSGTALAQGAPGSGMGAGMRAAGPGASAPGMGMGPGMRAGRGPGARWGADVTPGWSLMTPAERTEHQARMRSMKTPEECKAAMEQHRELMATRAKEKGGKPLAQPRRDACMGLKP